MASGFMFYRDAHGAPTGLKTIKAGGDIKKGDPITVNGAVNDEAIIAASAAPTVLGVAMSAGSGGDEILYIPARKSVQFKVKTTAAYTDATHRNEIHAIDTSESPQGITLGNTDSTGGSFVIEGPVPDEDFEDGSVAWVYGHFINTVLDD